MGEAPTLLDFVRTTLGSLWAVEQLLLMSRAPDQDWSVDDLVKDLRASEPLVRANLTRLENAGLISPAEGGLYRFQPANDDLRALCADLAIVYQERPHTVRNAIFSTTDRLQEFADAFRFGRKNP